MGRPLTEDQESGEQSKEKEHAELHGRRLTAFQTAGLLAEPFILSLSSPTYVTSSIPWYPPRGTGVIRGTHLLPDSLKLTAP